MDSLNTGLTLRVRGVGVLGVQGLGLGFCIFMFFVLGLGV